MSLNVNKTKMCIFGSKTTLRKLGPIEIHFGNAVIKPDEHLKCLGLTLDNRLTWKTHINNLTKKLNFSLNTLQTLKPFLTQKNLLLLTNALTLSNINYMAIIWGEAKNEDLKLVEKCVRRAGRLILDKTKKDKIRDEITTNLKWIFPTYLFQYKMCIFIHSILFFPVHIPYFNNYLQTHDIPYNTRSYFQNFQSTRCINNYGTRKLSYIANTLWRSIPIEIRRTEDTMLFKQDLRSYLLGQQLNRV